MAWSRFEVETIVSDYLSMLKRELQGLTYNKTEHRNNLLLVLPNRNNSSIEFKHQNISAVLISFNLPYLKGYKPRWNYQNLLEVVVGEQVSQDSELEVILDNFSIQPITEPGSLDGFEYFEDSPPQASMVSEPSSSYQKLIKKNYLEIEQRNKYIGDQGEELAYRYEKWRLEQAGKFSLIPNIEWVSREQGDGAGYDILSFNLDGTKRYIEVKSTTQGKSAPIFFTHNEKMFAERNIKDFFLYRIYNLAVKPKMFRLEGKFEDFCYIEPTSYKGYF